MGGGAVLVVISDLSVVEACAFKWRSPAWQAAALPSGAKRLAPAARAVPEGPPAALLTIAAQYAFWEMERSFVQKLGKHIGAVVPDGSSLLETLAIVVQHVLQCDLDRAMEVLQRRMAVLDLGGQWCDELMEVEEAASLLDRHDSAVMTQQKARATQGKEESKAFRQAYVARRQASSGSGASKGRKHATMSAKSLGLRAGRIPPIGTIPHSQAKQWAPPKSSVWRGVQSGSWQGHMEPFGRISRSWNRYGEEEALRLVLVHLWQNFCDLQGVRYEDCPLQGLLEQGSTATSSDGR